MISTACDYSPLTRPLRPVVDQLDPQSWDRFIESGERGSIFQSHAWGEARRVTGWRPIRLAVIDDTGPLAVVQIGLRQLGPFRVLYAQRGPVLRPGDDRGLDLLLRTTVELARAEGVTFIKLNPELTSEDSRLEQFKRGGYRAVTGDAYAHLATYRIDLRSGEDVVRARFEGRTRRAIAHARRSGVVVRSGNDRDFLESFLALARSTASRRGFPAPGADFLEELRVRLGPLEKMQIFIARHGHLDVAGAITLRFAGRCTYMWGGSTADRELKRANPSEAVQEAAIVWAIRNGCAVYDLQGVPLGSDGEPLKGPALFKRGFGGTLIRFVGDLDRPIQPLLYKVWRRLEPAYLRMKGVTR